MRHRISVAGVFSSALALALPLALSLVSAACFGVSDPNAVDGGAVLGTQPVEDAAVAVGPAKLELVAENASVNFGLVDCGSPASQQTLTFKNAGGEPLHWSALIEGGNNFSLGGTKSGTVEAGETATIVVRSAPVAATTHAGTVSTATVVLETNSEIPRTEVPVKLTAAGAELSLVPTTIDFGLYPVGSAAPDVPLTLKNDGNKAVTIAITQPSDNQFGVTWSGAPAAITLAANATAVGLMGQFKPSTSSPSSSFASLSFTGAVCGESPAQIAMKGQGSNGVVGVTPAGLDFGQVDCGTTANAKKVTVSNTGNGAFTFAAKLDAAGSNTFTVSPATGSVAPGGIMEVTVTPKAIPAAAPVTANAFGGALTITTSAVGDAAHGITLTQTAHGAILTANPSSVNFASVPVATSQTAGVTLTNAGNAPANVTISASGTGFSVTPATGAMTAGDTLAATATFAPAAAGAATGALKIGATGAVLCAPLPADVPLSGTGTSGSVSLSAQNFDFGATNCGSTATAKTLTLQNPGNASYTWTATLGSSRYALSKASGSVSAGGSDALTITPAAIPQTSAVPGTYGDVLTVTTNVPGDAPHALAITQSAQGAILKFVPTTAISFGQVALNATSTASFTVANEGTVAASPVLTSSNSTVTLSPSSFALAGAGTNAVLATFRPTASGTVSGTVSLASTGTLCAPLPTALSFSGQGTVGAATVSPAAVSFGESGYANCGTQASTQAITVKNDGTASFAITSVTVPSGYSYTAPAGTTVAAGSSVSLVVTPPAVPATLSAVTSYNGTMAIDTNIPGDSTHNVALSMTSRGAILAHAGSTTVTFTDTAWPGSSAQTASFTNVGNTSATLTASTTASSGFTGPSSITVGTTGGSGSFTFRPTTAGAHAASVTLSAAAGSVLCSAVPGTMRLTGTGLAGVLSVSSASFDFGTVNCGTSPSQQNLTVTNRGNAAITNFYATLGGSRFYQKGFPTSSTSATSLAAGASTTAAVVVNSNEFGASTDTLTVYGYAPVSSIGVPLSVKRTGALVTASPSSFSITMSSAIGSGSFELANSGDQAISLTASVSGSTGSSWQAYFSSTQKPDVTLAASGGADKGVVQVYKWAAGTATGTMTFTQSGNGGVPVCGSLPTVTMTTQ
jgi:hypothetical protein